MDKRSIGPHRSSCGIKSHSNPNSCPVSSKNHTSLQAICVCVLRLRSWFVKMRNKREVYFTWNWRAHLLHWASAKYIIWLYCRVARITTCPGSTTHRHLSFCTYVVTVPCDPWHCHKIKCRGGFDSNVSIDIVIARPFFFIGRKGVARYFQMWSADYFGISRGQFWICVRSN